MSNKENDDNGGLIVPVDEEVDESFKKSNDENAILLQYKECSEGITLKKKERKKKKRKKRKVKAENQSVENVLELMNQGNKKNESKKMDKSKSERSFISKFFRKKETQFEYEWEDPQFLKDIEKELKKSNNSMGSLMKENNNLLGQIGEIKVEIAKFTESKQKHDDKLKKVSKKSQETYGKLSKVDIPYPDLEPENYGGSLTFTITQRGDKRKRIIRGVRKFKICRTLFWCCLGKEKETISIWG